MRKNPVDWNITKQAGVETDTCGSDCSSARTCVEHTLDMRITLRCLGVPIHLLSYTFGDNKIFVDSIMTPHGKMHKRHAALSFYRVRESVAAGIFNCQLIDRKSNLADVLIKN